MSPKSVDMQPMEYFYHVSSFRSVSSTLRNEIFADMLLVNPDGNELITLLLSVAVNQPKTGSLSVLEQIEERWMSLWDELCAIDCGVTSLSDGKDDDLVGSKPGESETKLLSRGSTTSENANNNTTSVGSGSSHGLSRGILETAARAGLLPFVSSAFSRVPPAAELAGMITQMTDMGLPREWAEAALKRCRYNVEMAINMCFENGVDMAQIVSEEVSYRSKLHIISSNQFYYYTSTGFPNYC
jgi:hypothetical protein